MSTSTLVYPNECRLNHDDIRSFNLGANGRMYRKLGAHLVNCEGRDGAHFGVWAPNAKLVSVIGDFNGWSVNTNVLERRDDSGVFEGVIAGVTSGTRYKY